MTAGAACSEPVRLSDEGAGGGGAPAPKEASQPAAWFAGGVEGGGCSKAAGVDSLESSASESALESELMPDIDTEVSGESTGEEKAWPVAQLAGGVEGGGCTVVAGAAFEPERLSDEGAGEGGAPAPREASQPAAWLAGGVEGGRIFNSRRIFAS